MRAVYSERPHKEACCASNRIFMDFKSLCLRRQGGRVRRRTRRRRTRTRRRDQKEEDRMRGSACCNRRTSVRKSQRWTRKSG